MKILLVEDDPTAALLTESILKSLGHDVMLAPDGTAACALLEEHSFRAVVSDWQMSNMDGLALCRHIREREGGYVYFILLTQMESSGENQLAAMEAGVDDFLTKPVRPADMRVRLHVAERILAFTEQVKQLEEFLPICSYCRKVRDDKNYWAELEEYITKHSGSSFSHGVCPDCYEKVMVPQMKKFGVVPPAYKPPRSP